MKSTFYRISGCLIVLAMLALVGSSSVLASKSITSIPLQEEPVFVPSPPTTYTVGCGQEVVIAHIQHWDNATYPDTFVYRANFLASGGPATITLEVTDGYGDFRSMSLPAGSSELGYKLEALKGLVEDVPTDAQVKVTTPACALDSVASGSVVIKALNIHTSPLP